MTTLQDFVLPERLLQAAAVLLVHDQPPQVCRLGLLRGLRQRQGGGPAGRVEVAQAELEDVGAAGRRIGGLRGGRSEDDGGGQLGGR